MHLKKPSRWAHGRPSDPCWPVLARAATGRNELRDYAAWPPVACMSAVRIVLVSLNVKSGATMYSGAVSFPLRAGPVAIVSKSGGLCHNAFSPLMNYRQLGFRYVISCGNASVTTVEDYVSYLVDDSKVEVIAGIIESLTKPQLLFDAAQRARESRKSIVFFQPGRSEVGQAMIRSHTEVLVRDSEVLAAFLRRCGIVQIESYDTFIETIEVWVGAAGRQAHAPTHCRLWQRRRRRRCCRRTGWRRRTARSACSANGGTHQRSNARLR